jgi:hypothetical protein
MSILGQRGRVFPAQAAGTALVHIDNPDQDLFGCERERSPLPALEKHDRVVREWTSSCRLLKESTLALSACPGQRLSLLSLLSCLGHSGVIRKRERSPLPALEKHDRVVREWTSSCRPWPASQAQAGWLSLLSLLSCLGHSGVIRNPLALGWPARVDMKMSQRKG